MMARFFRFNDKVPMALPIIMPMALIMMGEAFLFAGKYEGSIAVHLLNILICVMVPILLRENPIIWQAFLLVSMLRVLNLGMPRFMDPTLYWMPMIYAPIILVGFMLVRDETLGHRNYLRELKRFFNLSSRISGWKTYYLPIGIIIALVLANIEFKILNLSIPDLRLVPDLSLGNMILLFSVMVFFVGLGEELVFRYILQARLESSVGVIGAMLITSLAFSMMHSGYGSYIYMAYVFCVSLVLGFLYYRTKSLAFVALVHGALNFFLFSLLPFGYLTIF